MKEPKYSLYSLNNGSDILPDKLLDEVLKSDNIMPLPADFADRMAVKAVKRYILKQSLSEFFVYIGVILLAGIILCAAFYFTSPEAWSRWGNVLLPKWNFILGTAAIAFFVFFADSVILPWLIFRWKKEESGSY